MTEETGDLVKRLRGTVGEFRAARDYLARHATGQRKGGDDGSV